MGFYNVTITAAEKDRLNYLINDMKPRLFIMGSNFYESGTPYMVGELHKDFKRLNIAVVALSNFPVTTAPWFIWYGAQSFVNWWEGEEEFKLGMQTLLKGKTYISPKVQQLIDRLGEWPEVTNSETKRLNECLKMLCSGLSIRKICELLNLARQTVNNHLDRLYKSFHVNGREEMVALAWTLELVCKEDIQLYTGLFKKTEEKTLPAWAVSQIKLNKINKELTKEK